MKYFNIIVALSLIVFASCVNTVKYKSSHRELSISTDTSIITAFISNKNIERGIKTINSLDYYWFKNERIKFTRGGFSGKLLDGAYEVFDFKWNLVVKGSFKHGLKDGVWLCWNNRGNLISISEYKDGFLDGKYIYFNLDGTYNTITFYKKGVISNKQPLSKDKGIIKNTQSKNEKLLNDQDTSRMGNTKRTRRLNLKNFIKKSKQDTIMNNKR